MESDDAHVVICPGRLSNTFENYVIMKVEDVGFIAIRHIIQVNEDTKWKKKS